MKHNPVNSAGIVTTGMRLLLRSGICHLRHIAQHTNPVSETKPVCV
ncbi:hypothetical protein ACFQ21_19090 [Ohtaekwangia kribbensis]|uniref:Uncharacterized protein n=1 Tax=Ohtaekwangia kribbensis TaxID=688913 RepID=A0ABW3K8S0_9BACT